MCVFFTSDPCIMVLFLLNISQPIDICHLKIPQTAKELSKICTNIQQLDFGVSRGFLQCLNLCRLSKVSRSICVIGNHTVPYYILTISHFQQSKEDQRVSKVDFLTLRRARLAHDRPLLDSLDGITSTKLKCCFKCFSTILSNIELKLT